MFRESSAKFLRNTGRPNPSVEQISKNVVCLFYFPCRSKRVESRDKYYSRFRMKRQLSKWMNLDELSLHSDCQSVLTNVYSERLFHASTVDTSEAIENGSKRKKMEVKRVRVTNRKQFNLLVDRMTANPSVARGQKFCEAAGINRHSYEQVWNEMTNGLNSFGPPIRTVKDWQKVWTDYKCSVKNKLAHNSREAKATGGGPNSMKVLSANEDAVVKLLSLEKMVNHSGSSFGLLVHPTSVPSAMPSSSQPRKTPSPPGSPMLSSIIEPQLDTAEEGDPTAEEAKGIENTQDSEQNRSSRTAQRKQRCQHNMDIRHDLLLEQTECMRKSVEHSGECARYARKMFKLREQEVKERRANWHQKEKDRKAELEYKLELLKYKKAKLEILERQEYKK